MNLPEYIQQHIPIDWSQKITVPDAENLHGEVLLSDWLQAMLIHWGWDVVDEPILDQRESIISVTGIEPPYYVMTWNNGKGAVTMIFGKEHEETVLLSRIYKENNEWKIDTAQPCDTHARLEEWRGWYSERDKKEGGA